MKKYEMLSIIKPNLDMDEVEKVIKSLEEQIASFGGNVLSVDRMGRKKLAYEIEKFRDGFFVVLNIELATEKVKELRRYIKLSESFLREMIFDASNVKVEAK